MATRRRRMVKPRRLASAQIPRENLKKIQGCQGFDIVNNRVVAENKSCNTGQARSLEAADMGLHESQRPAQPSGNHCAWASVAVGMHLWRTQQQLRILRRRRPHEQARKLVQ